MIQYHGLRLTPTVGSVRTLRSKPIRWQSPLKILPGKYIIQVDFLEPVSLVRDTK
jgi:hypothetical protein